MLLFIVVFCLIVALGLGIAAALSDWRGFIIPNAYPAGILVAFVPAYGAFLWLGAESGFFDEWMSHALAFAISFVLTFALFSLKLFGAGDSKLCAAFSIWVGLPGLMAFFFYMALAGGVLGIMTILLKKYKFFPDAPAGTWLAQAQEGINAVPYGIAITAGAVIAFFYLGYFSPAQLMLLANSPRGP